MKGWKEGLRMYLFTAVIKKMPRIDPEVLPR
jgi:hypothetical protein